ncbi:hypothetical protein I6K87_06260 [Streptococcus anginosus]|uniref:Uncharacterized protein n=1 Tax=Streptococcus anginosus TaxID=1328 RepID=A0AAP6BRK6_STRAP|nr:MULTISPECIES: hypothetical protein [Streptococcus]ALL02361.1 hypothetical protein SanJ4211_0274 [Streptococcus anginosus]MCW1036322.1 hypothetical protein [Streptococcus anginosus]MCW1051423.1 hypothetical protein [Streptococcus anginosus]MCW1066250.1 hypothetical protein [Streptococcus anginosus]MCW1076207.1 hypothetical protein [Streptococcus anginosus]
MLKRKRAFEGYKKRSEFGFDKSKLTFFKVFSWVHVQSIQREPKEPELYFSCLIN